MVNALPVSTTTTASCRRGHGPNWRSAMPWIGRAEFAFGFKNKLRRPRVAWCRWPGAGCQRGNAVDGGPATEGNAWRHRGPVRLSKKQKNCITLANRMMPQRFAGPLPRPAGNRPPHTRRDVRGHSVLRPSIAINTSPTLMPDREGAANAVGRFQLPSPNRRSRGPRFERRFSALVSTKR